MRSYRYVVKEIVDSDASFVARGHNKKFRFGNEGEITFFKYDAEKERKGNLQKRFASGFCSYLTDRYGGNFVYDVPGDVVFRESMKSSASTRLKGVFSDSYKNDYHIYDTFTLDEVLKPREDEEFEYNNKQRVFSSVENSLRRLKSYISERIAEAKGNSVTAPYNPYAHLNHLDEDFAKIEEDLVSIVMLDYLFLNNDRHTENVEFSIVFDNNHDYRLVVSPVFDNDRTFGLDCDAKTMATHNSSKFARGSYIDFVQDLKYVIRDLDCDDAFVKQMNFGNNYHSDVISNYIRGKCSDARGNLDPRALESNQLYRLYTNYRDIDIKQEFYNYLSEVAGIDAPIARNMTASQESEFISRFNKAIGATMTVEHVNEVVQQFAVRQNLLTQSMERYCPMPSQKHSQ